MPGNTPNRALFERVKKVQDTFEPEHYTLQHINLALTGLKPEDVPDVDAGLGDPDKEISKGILSCLTLLCSAGRACRLPSPPSYKKRFIDLMVESTAGICEWQRWLLRGNIEILQGHELQVTCASQAVLLLGMMAIDPKVAYAFLDTPTTLDILIMVWTTVDPAAPRGLGFMINYDSNVNGDAVLNLLRQFIYTFAGRDALIEKASSTGILKFARALTGRAVQVRYAIHRRGYSPGMMSYVKNLVDFLGRLLTSQSMDLRWALEKTGYLITFGELLYDIAATLNRLVPARRFLKELVKPALDLTWILSREKYHAVRNWADLIDGRFEATLSFITTGLAPDDEENIRMITDALLEMGSYTIFPCVLRKLLIARRREDANILIKAQETPGVGTCWKEFWISTRRRAELFEDWEEAGTLNICDNPGCDRVNRASDREVKKCSKCYSVVYCSPRCQRSDWVKQHRNECVKARKEYFANDIGPRYRHSLRDFHLRHVEKLYTTHSAALDQSRGDTPANSTIATVDCTVAKETIALDRIKDKTADFWSDRVLHNPYDHFAGRLKALGDAYTSDSGDPQARLVEAIFLNGASSEVHLAILLKKVGDRFVAVYSIPRRGIRIEGSESGSDSGPNA